MFLGPLGASAGATNIRLAPTPFIYSSIRSSNACYRHAGFCRSDRDLKTISRAPSRLRRIIFLPVDSIHLTKPQWKYVVSGTSRCPVKRHRVSARATMLISRAPRGLGRTIFFSTQSHSRKVVFLGLLGAGANVVGSLS